MWDNLMKLRLDSMVGDSQAYHGQTDILRVFFYARTEGVILIYKRYPF